MSIWTALGEAPSMPRSRPLLPLVALILAVVAATAPPPAPVSAPWKGRKPPGKTDPPPPGAATPAADGPGPMLLTPDVPGAEVFLDGVRKDAVPTLIEGVSEGGHTIEVKKEGMQPWKQVVPVVGGQQIKVIAQLNAPPAAAGALK